MSRGCKDLTRPTLIIYNLKITGLARRFFPETVLKQDTLLLYNPKQCRGTKKVCPFFLLENSRPLSPWGPLDFLSICLGIDSLTYVWEQGNSDKNLNTQALLSFLLLTILTSPSLPVVFIHNSSSNSIKYSNLRKTFPSPFTHLPSFLHCRLNYN